MLAKTVSTALNLKLITSHQDLFVSMVVDAVQSLVAAPDGLNDLRRMIAIKRIPGGNIWQSFLVKDMTFKKTLAKRFNNPKILLLNVKLELKNEKENSEMRIKDVPEHCRRQVAVHLRQTCLLRQLCREYRACVQQSVQDLFNLLAVAILFPVTLVGREQGQVWPPRTRPWNGGRDVVAVDKLAGALLWTRL